MTDKEKLIEFILGLTNEEAEKILSHLESEREKRHVVENNDERKEIHR